MNEEGLLPIEVDAFVLECADAAALADFYIRLLGWEKYSEEAGVWTDIVSPSGGARLAFQQNADFIPPVWPDEPGRQQQMAHLDFVVKSAGQMEAAVRRALCRGAVKTEAQFGGDEWVTLLDPAGHPFCFVLAAE